MERNRGPKEALTDSDRSTDEKIGALDGCRRFSQSRKIFLDRLQIFKVHLLSL
jgi:hypothetical protein